MSALNTIVHNSKNSLKNSFGEISLNKLKIEKVKLFTQNPTKIFCTSVLSWSCLASCLTFRPFLTLDPQQLGGAESGKINALLILVVHQPDIDKTYLYAKDLYETKYQLLTNKRKGVALTLFKIGGGGGGGFFPFKFWKRRNYPPKLSGFKTNPFATLV